MGSRIRRFPSASGMCDISVFVLDGCEMIRYLNTDLDLNADFSLSSLARALESKGVFALHAEERDDGLWYATFEIEGEHDDELHEPEFTLNTMLNAINELGDDDRSSLKNCSLCEFNIGYDCGDEPWAFNNGITNPTLRRMATLGASLRITLYPPECKEVT